MGISSILWAILLYDFFVHWYYILKKFVFFARCRTPPAGVQTGWGKKWTCFARLHSILDFRFLPHCSRFCFTFFVFLTRFGPDSPVSGSYLTLFLSQFLQFPVCQFLCFLLRAFAAFLLSLIHSRSIAHSSPHRSPFEILGYVGRAYFLIGAYDLLTHVGPLFGYLSQTPFLW